MYYMTLQIAITQSYHKFCRFVIQELAYRFQDFETNLTTSTQNMLCYALDVCHTKAVHLASE